MFYKIHFYDNGKCLKILCLVGTLLLYWLLTKIMIYSYWNCFNFVNKTFCNTWFAYSIQSSMYFSHNGCTVEIRLRESFNTCNCYNGPKFFKRLDRPGSPRWKLDRATSCPSENKPLLSSLSTIRFLT